ncbi:MAG: hypothetical protein H6729_16615 [Deltaproteobacteria bacterium]|nr:hypothetical protein [Deltaproteobacteria bacterium]
MTTPVAGGNPEFDEDLESDLAGRGQRHAVAPQPDPDPGVASDPSPLVRAALTHLEVVGPNKYRFKAGAQAAISELLNTACAGPEDPTESIQTLIALTVVFEEQLKQPNEAAVITEAIKASPGAMRLLRRSVGMPEPPPEAAVPAKAGALLGVETQKTAPLHDGAAPEGSMQLRALIQPGGQRRPIPPREGSSKRRPTTSEGTRANDDDADTRSRPRRPTSRIV